MIARRLAALSRRPVEAVSFLGISINLLTSDSLLHLVAESISASRKTVIAHHNLHSLCMHSSSSRDAAQLRRFYDDADYTLADGMSMVALGKLYGRKIQPQNRVAYNDWLPSMLPVAVRKRWRIFYLGSTADVAAKGAQVLTSRYPRLQLKTHTGHFDVQRFGFSNRRVLSAITNFQPHLLFVGMGMPRQERWIQENLNEIDANVILPSGATLDYIAGAKRMAPRWMGALGLEWSFRLATEPRRLASRYLFEPWGLISAVITDSIQTSRDQMTPVQQDPAE